jgi:PAT family beta-lactamase induction signal transducer AmpG
MLALLYLPMLAVTWKAPEPPGLPPPPRTLRDAVWLPFVGFLARRRALEILAFVILYRLTDNLAQSLQRPFLVEMGYSDFDRGFALSTIGLAGTLTGVFLGGAATSPLGALQAFSNAGYVVLANLGHADRPVMYAAIGFETLAAGLGMGALSVLLLRMTQKRFSATQYALFSSLFGLPRLVAGPICGFLVDAVGWTRFFWFAILAGLPALLLLIRFAPSGRPRPPSPGLRPPDAAAGPRQPRRSERLADPARHRHRRTGLRPPRRRGRRRTSRRRAGTGDRPGGHGNRDVVAGRCPPARCREARLNLQVASSPLRR